MTLQDILEARIGGRVALICPAPLGDILYAVEEGREVPEDVQRAFWKAAGTFYALGGDVGANPAWSVTHSPETPEAERLATTYSRPVTLAFSRPRRPRELLEEGLLAGLGLPKGTPG